MDRYLSIPLPIRIGMLCAFGFALLLWAGPVRADAIARKGSEWVRLTISPCKDAQVVGHIQAQGMDPDLFRAGSAHLGGQDYAACWRPAPGGAAMVYSDGDGGFVPLEALKPVPEA